MKQTLSVSKILGAYKILNEAPLYNVTDKLSVLKLLRVLKPHVTAYEEISEDTHTKLRPANWDELTERYRNGDKEALSEYMQEVTRCLQGELHKEVEVEFDPVTEQTISELCTKDTKAGILVELIEIFCN